jgi:hypothetical protein
MNNVSTIISYLCAAAAGVCFVSGIAVLRGGKSHGNA